MVLVTQDNIGIDIIYIYIHYYISHHPHQHQLVHPLTVIRTIDMNLLRY
jgi:hypothetical protein